MRKLMTAAKDFVMLVAAAPFLLLALVLYRHPE